MSTTQEHDQCPSEFGLERWQAGELEGSDAGRALGSHVRACPACSARLAEFSLQPPPFALDQVWHAAGAPERGSPRTAPAWNWRRIFTRGLALPIGAVAGMAAVALLWPRPGAPPIPSDLLKGAPWGFTVLAKARGKQEVTPVISGARLSPGDRLRFEVSTAWPVGYVAVVSLDSAGVVSILAPATGRAVEVRQGRPVLLNDAVELDETLGPERIDLLGCRQPVAISTFAAAARQALARERGNLKAVGTIVPGCHQETLWIEKIKP